jgi:hypothetical protein
MKNLTISGKSVFWTLQDGTNVVCRVVRKKGGEDLVKLVENGVTEFEFEPGNRINHASYLLYQQKRVVRINRKAFGFLQRFLAEKTNLIDTVKNDLQSTSSPTNSNDLSCFSLSGSCDDSQHQSCETTHEPLVWLESCSEVVSHELRVAETLLHNITEGRRDNYIRKQGFEIVPTSLGRISSKSILCEMLAEYDRKLSEHSRYGEYFVEEGRQLQKSNCELERVRKRPK